MRLIDERFPIVMGGCAIATLWCDVYITSNPECCIRRENVDNRGFDLCGERRETVVELVTVMLRELNSMLFIKYDSIVFHFFTWLFMMNRDRESEN